MEEYASHWDRLEELFAEAVGIPDESKAAFVGRVAAADPELGEQLRSLLRHDSGAAARIAGAIEGAANAVVAPIDWTGGHFGPYRIVREIGRGGMGEVFLARRDDQEFDRLVAVKIVRRGPDLNEVLRRFRQERQILARLDHPNIARLLDGGSTSDGVPYLVMEYVDGVPITAYCDSHTLGIEDRCRLMLAVCDAVRQAHSNLVVHRDLKPSNILVTAAGIPKLLDFGIAKLLDSERAVEGETATLWNRLLTPEYASPEQFQGAPITTATDVYLLGAVLFQLLTGSKPHQLTRYTPEEFQRAIIGTPIPKPSQARPEWSRGLRGDLDNIVLRATHAEPADRYGSAQELADDLRRYLDHRPVLARPDSVWYRAGKWVRRSPVAAAALLLAILSITAGVAGTMYQARRAERRFQQVRNLARTFVFDVHDQIATLPGATAARKTIVSTALTYLENLSREAGGEAGLTRELAAAYLKIGEVQGDPIGSNLGDWSGAMQSYRRAESLLSGLKPLGDPATGKLLMEVYQQISVLQQSQGGDRAAAVASARKGQEYARQVLARQSNDTELLREAVDIDTNLSHALSASGDEAGAEHVARSALALAEKLAAGPSADAAKRSTLADAISNLGVLQGLRGDLDSAAVNFHHLVEIRERIAQGEPGNVVFQRQLMVAYGHVGDVLGFRPGEHLGEFAGAAEALGKAVAIAEWLTRQDPLDEKARLDLAAAKLRLGTVLLDLGQGSTGLRQLQDADALIAPLLEKNPASRNYAGTSIALKNGMSLALAGQGRIEESLRIGRQALAEAKAGYARRIVQRGVLLGTQLRSAMVLSQTGRAGEAGQLAGIVQAAYDADPRLLNFGWIRAYIYSCLANVYRKTGQVRQAEAALRQSREVWSAIAGGPALSALRQRELQRLDRELAALHQR